MDYEMMDNNDLTVVPPYEGNKWLTDEDFEEVEKWDTWFEKNYSEDLDRRYYRYKNKLGLTAVYFYNGRVVARVSLKANRFISYVNRGK